MKATFNAVLSLPLACYLSGFVRADSDSHNGPVDANTYDYIVVGGGVSGLVVAGCLTEDRRPVMGGGSVVNGMGYIRGGKIDYDAWEELGNTGWGWQGLLPCFSKSTTFTPPYLEAIRQWNITFDPSVHGHGPLHTHIPSFHLVSWCRLAAMLAAGQGRTGLPQLLQVSGIGSRDVLREAAIPVKRDTPAVGANLQDHATTMMSFDLANPSLLNPSAIFTNATYNATVWAEYLANKTGPIAAAGATTVILFSRPQLSTAADAAAVVRRLLAQTALTTNQLLLWPSLGHLSGTCAMMPGNLGGCVGPDLKVYGVDGLSVVDASMMPLTVSGALQATVYAVAEKVADLIKARSGH
ncbi:hypothetical protein B0T26DRAFT_669454 [Lasiosphaeria miniovina]|uniref:Glucose-methanol-choline oxidoreductase N-terminal domain-containing protein n=1 Tax=Lasiosphaeria miniovina TaxID=1954250 RepID=A0AA40EC93_9PEZI|nr:uncharacterized protein B0T26DRAFT_669454 [Lasiosphaeria miniovina]KAK0732997.1 hypothetical protein B0T26DRAFT_669454 [Lasiosphaeria miniovina]